MMRRLLIASGVTEGCLISVRTWANRSRETHTSPSGSGYTTPFAVPTGKRLVIEEVSSSGLPNGGEKPSAVGIQFNHGPTRVTFFLSLHESAGVPTGGGYAFTMSQALRLYADSGSVRFSRTITRVL